MIKKIKESTLRKQLINAVLDLNKQDLLQFYIEMGYAEYTLNEVDWDVQDGRSIITKFLPDEE